MSAVVQLAWPFVALCALGLVAWFLKTPLPSRKQQATDAWIAAVEKRVGDAAYKLQAVDRLQADLAELQRKVDRHEVAKIGRLG